MTTPHKLGVLVAIPIKGRKLINRSGGKQSPYVQLKLGEQKKRTRASLIASVEPEWDQEVRLDVFHGQLDMLVSVYDEGKKNELIGEGVLLLNEVIDKGELDVWFPIKYSGTASGDIYFELTFYAAAPPPAAGTTPPPAQAQIHPPIRHSQPGFQGGPNMHPVPHTPPTSNYGSPGINNMHTGGPPAPYPGNMYQHPGPGGFNPGARPFPPAQHQAFPPQPNPSPYGGPATSGPGFNQQYGNPNNTPFRPLGGAGMPGGPFPNNASPQFGNTPIPGPYGAAPGSGPPQGPNMGGYPNHMPHMPQPQPFNQGGNNSNNNSYPPQSNSSHNSTNNNMPSMYPGFPQGPGSGPSNSYPNSAPNSYPNHGPNNNFSNNRPPNSYPANNNFNNGNNPNNINNNNNNNNNSNNNSNNSNVAPGQAPVTPLVQYNYSLGSFP